MLFYKYKSNFDIYVMDIIVHSRMYLSSYKKLNDPMEGVLGFDPWFKDGAKNLNIATYSERCDARVNAINEYGILSLSRSPEISLMWGHYADGFRGVCIEVELSEEAASNLYAIDYEADLSKLSDDDPIGLLTHKTKEWDYEQESRVLIKPKYRPYVQLERVNKIIMGSMMDSSISETISSIARNYKIGLACAHPDLDGLVCIR